MFYILDEALHPYIDQINDIETAVNILEQSAYKIDAYSKKLGMCTIYVMYESVDSLSTRSVYVCGLVFKYSLQTYQLVS